MPNFLCLTIEQIRRQPTQQAANELWTTYFDRLAGRVRRMLSRMPRQIMDEEDIASSTIESFLIAIQEGQYPNVHSDSDVWRLLITISRRKVVDYYRYVNRGKRKAESTTANDFDHLAYLSPHSYVSEDARMRELLEGLNRELRNVAQARLAGYCNLEIADREGCSLRTIERRLSQLRRALSSDDS